MGPTRRTRPFSSSMTREPETVATGRLEARQISSIWRGSPPVGRCWSTSDSASFCGRSMLSSICAGGGAGVSVELAVWRRVVGIERVDTDVEIRWVLSSERMSLTSSTSLAPSWIRRLAPALARLVMLPGTAKTSRPCSAAKRVVMSAPLSVSKRISQPATQHAKRSKFRAATATGRVPTRAIGLSPSLLHLWLR
jgi:hypothetical protein